MRVGLLNQMSACVGAVKAISLVLPEFMQRYFQGEVLEALHTAAPGKDDAGEDMRSRGGASSNNAFGATASSSGMLGSPFSAVAASSNPFQ